MFIIKPKTQWLIFLKDGAHPPPNCYMRTLFISIIHSYTHLRGYNAFPLKAFVGARVQSLPYCIQFYIAEQYLQGSKYVIEWRICQRFQEHAWKSNLWCWCLPQNYKCCEITGFTLFKCLTTPFIFKVNKWIG